jgi:WD40 repeat protein
MKHWYILIVMHILTLHLSCLGMNCFKEITLVNNPVSVAYLDDHRLVIAGDRCVLINFINDEVRKLNNEKIFHLALNKNRTRFALLNEKQLVVYSAFNLKKIKSTKEVSPLSSIIFSPNRNIIFAYFPGKLTLFNYVTKLLQNCGIQSFIQNTTTQISCHPTKNILLYSRTENILSSMHFTLDHKCTIEDIYNAKEDVLLGGMYSPDGNFIFINNFHNGCYIYDPLTKFSYKLFKSIRDNPIAVDFHPYRPILAMLIDNSDIQYWNYKIKDLIGRVQTIKNTSRITYSNTIGRVAFSPNGNKLAIALNDKCIILNVPQNNFFIVYWLFKYYGIPRELISFMIQKYIETCGLQDSNLIEFVKT